jgi:NitT/TauT family transport system substrate-binding protein
MSIQRTLGAAGLALAVSLAISTTAGAADKITIMVGGVEKQIYLPAALTESLGYFKDEGLDVQILNETAGVDAEKELLAGAVQGVVGFYDHCVDLQPKGKFVESVVQFSQAPGEVELVSSKHPEIKSMADVKGKTLGVTGLGSSTNFLTQYLAARAGVQLSDYTVLGVGAGTTFIAAMQQDRIQLGMTTEPTVSHLLATGEARILVDMRGVEKTKAALGGTYPAAAFYMDAAYVQAHKDVVQKLANAFVKTLKYMHTHTAAEITEKMPKSYYAADKPAYIKALADGMTMFTTDGVMPEGGPETVLAVLQAKSSMKGQKVDLAKTYTTEFVRNVK